MKKMNKKAFTLIELLIVIAIIGILFIVLVSRVDFATDKAKATGVQTDFRSFQVAFEQVAKENAGFNTFGWDEGDLDGNRVRNSYDLGDKGCTLDTDCGNCHAQDGIMDEHETWVGRKEYTETWTGVWTLKKYGSSTLDSEAVGALERAINANLDPKLHISIDGEGNITMANQARDPWKTEYVGRYITNASELSTTNTVADNKVFNTVDHDGDSATAKLTAAEESLDRGAIIIYSKGANAELGCVEEVVKGEVVVTVLTPSKEVADWDQKTDSNKAGLDDYSVFTIYTYKNGYGEVVSGTTGFSNNQ
jgi:prepilin-type N-terminal cleavage/methylation domain-containing protein